MNPRIVRELSDITASFSHGGEPILAYEHAVPGRDGGTTEFRAYEEPPEDEGPHDVQPVVLVLSDSADVVIQQWSEEDSSPMFAGVAYEGDGQYVDEYAYIPRTLISGIVRQGDAGYENQVQVGEENVRRLCTAFLSRGK